MYKILIRYTSSSKKIFWYNYEIEQEDGTFTDFSTDNLDVLKTEIDKLDKQFGYDNIRVVNDITYKMLIDITETAEIGDLEIASSSDIDDIYDTAFTNVFG